MIYNVKDADWFCTELKDMGKDSHVTLKKGEIRNWFYTINKINSLKDGRKMLGEEELELYLVPKKLSDLITPSKVTVSQGTFERDFLDGKYKSAGDKEAFIGNAENYSPELLDAEQFEKVSRKLCRKFKLKEDLTKVSDLHVEVLLSTVQDRTSLNGMVVKDSKAFVPLLIEFFKFEDDEYSFNANRMWKQYMKDNFIHVNTSSNTGEKQDKED